MKEGRVATDPRVVWDGFTYPRVACFGGIVNSRVDSRANRRVIIRRGAIIAIVDKMRPDATVGRVLLPMLFYLGEKSNCERSRIAGYLSLRFGR